MARNVGKIRVSDLSILPDDDKRDLWQTTAERVRALQKDAARSRYPDLDQVVEHVLEKVSAHAAAYPTSRMLHVAAANWHPKDEQEEFAVLLADCLRQAPHAFAASAHNGVVEIMW
jgi:hypothetical protein